MQSFLVALAVLQALPTPSLCNTVKVVILSPICVGDRDTCGWPGGQTINAAMQTMVKRINDANFLQGGRTLEVTFVDDHCSGKYGLVEGAKILAMPQRPFGVLASGCSGSAAKTAQVLSVNRVPLISTAATSPGLSVRKDYPYLFRLQPVDNPMLRSFLFMYKSWGWKSIAQIADANFGAETGTSFEEMCKSLGMTNLLSGRKNAPGETSAKLLAEAAMQSVLKSRARGVVIIGYANYIAQYICWMSKFKVKGMVITHFGWFGKGWRYKDLGSHGCTASEIRSSSEFFVEANPAPWHTLSTQAPCGTAGYSVGNFKDNFHANMKAQGITFQAEASASAAADAVCMMARVFNKLIIDGASYASLYNMDETMFQKSFAIMQAMKFQGVSGEVDFPDDGTKDGSGDRIGAYEIFQNIQDTYGKVGKQMGFAAVTLFPGKEFKFDQGYTSNNLPPALYTECIVVGTIYDFQAGKCVGCPQFTTYFQAAGMCLSNRGYYTASPGDVRPCAAGNLSSTLGVASCSSCAPGRFAATIGQSECKQCQPGAYMDTSGASACKAAPKGTTVIEEGSTKPTLCSAGNHGPQVGQTLCKQCSLGRYQDKQGQELCKACPATFTTKHLGSANISRCICDEGTYHIRETADLVFGKCVPCGKGMVCPGDVDKLLNKQQNPLQAKGFSINKPEWPGQPFKYVVECDSFKKCPGDIAPGSCPENYALVKACDYCEISHFQDDGKCRDCSESEALVPLILTIPIVFIAAVLIYFLATRDPSVQPSAAMTVAITFGLSVNIMQVLGAFRELEVFWVEPILTLQKILKIFVFNIELLNPGCFLATNAPETKYIGSLFAHPIFAFVLTFFFFVGLKAFKRPLDRCHFANMHGFTMLLFYLALVIICFLPWQCRTNPDGTSSVVTSRSTQCWETTEHSVMLGASVFGILAYVVGFTALVIWATVQYPLQVMKPSGGMFLNGWRFLFQRFSVPCYFYGAVYLGRNFLIALLPVVCVDSPPTQLILLAFVIASTAASQAWLRPWRTLMANGLDLACSIGLIMVLMGGAALMKIDAKAGTESFQIIFALILFCMVFSVAGTLCGNVYLVLRKRHPFEIFLSHYKLAHAVLARWFKLRLRPLTGGDVFLDSDALWTLDRLIEVVAFETKNLVVILGKETLTRIWCVGEITSSEQHNLNIVNVACTNYVAPSDEFIDDLHNLWTLEQTNALVLLGVTIEDMQGAIRAFRKHPLIAMDRSLSYIEHDKVINQVCEQCKIRSLFGSAQSTESNATEQKTSTAGGEILIFGDEKNEEAGTIAVVLMMMLQKDHLKAIVNDKKTDDLIGPSVQCLVALLTPGVLMNMSFGRTVADAFASNLAVLIMAASPSFIFPSSTFVEELELGEEIVAGYKKLFNILALRFTPHGSQSIQQAEVGDLNNRISFLMASMKTVRTTASVKDINSDIRKTTEAPAVKTVADVGMTYF